MARAKKSKLKRVTRDWYVADIKIDGRIGVLDPRRGAKRVVVEYVGEDRVEHMTPEPMRVLRANIGDHLVLFGPDEAELADATVMRVESAGWADRLFVAIGYGMLRATTRSVHVLRGRRAV